MADITEVIDELRTIIAAACYPNGLAAASIGNCPIMIYQGWPEPQTFQRDLADGKVHISIFPRPGGKVTTVMLGDTEWTEVENSGTAGTSVLEIRRQTRTAQIVIWANSPSLRDTVAKRVDASLARVTRLAMPDGSQAIMTSIDEIQNDGQQKTQIYRRDLMYALNYATTFTEAEFTVLVANTTMSTGPTADAQGPAITIP